MVNPNGWNSQIFDRKKSVGSTKFEEVIKKLNQSRHYFCQSELVARIKVIIPTIEIETHAVVEQLSLIHI